MLTIKALIASLYWVFGFGFGMVWNTVFKAFMSTREEHDIDYILFSNLLLKLIIVNAFLP